MHAHEAVFHMTILSDIKGIKKKHLPYIFVSSWVAKDKLLLSYLEIGEADINLKMVSFIY